MGRLSLKMKIWLGFASVLVILTLVVGYEILKVQEIQEISAETASNVDARRNLNFARLSVEKRIAALRGYLIDENPVFLADYQKATSDAQSGMKKLEAHADSPEEKELFKSFEAGVETFVRFQDRVLELGRAGKTKEALEKTSSKEFMEARNAFRDGGEGIQKYFEQSADKGTAQGKNLIRSVQTTVIALLVLGLAVGSFLAFGMARGVVGSVRKMLELIQEISANNLAASDLKVDSQDEVGQAVAALNKMKNNLRGVIQSLSNNAQLVASSSEELSSTSQQMSANAEETSSQANVVSATGQQVNQNLQTVATGSAEMTASIQEIAKSAMEAAMVASEAVRVAENTTSTVSKLGDSSAEIGQVVKVITSIAQQTNLLALNATIEAARTAARVDILAIGTSTGGPNALADLLPSIPANFPVPIVIVQHMPPLFTRLLAERLNKQCAITVREGERGKILEPVEAWIAPGDHHMIVERQGTAEKLATNQDAPENSCRPGVDPLFRSVAKVYGANVLSVVLTGMGSDGVNGAQHIRESGGQVFVQDEATSVVWGMAAPVFWRHALGTALVSQHLAQQLGIPEFEKFYLAGLLHDIGILVNSQLFKEEFHLVLEIAETSETPLCEVEMQVLGFTHCDCGRILADIWKLPEDISGTIEFHHHPPVDTSGAEMTCTVYLADLLCRVRGLGYGYYEARQFDLAAEDPWRVLQKKYPAAAALDLARFTFELDEHAVQVQALVDSIFANGGAPASGNPRTESTHTTGTRSG